MIAICHSSFQAMHMVFFLCISCSYLQVTNTGSSTSRDLKDQSEYGIILDGGSSGTKLKIYKWRQASKSQESAIELALVESKKFAPGISAYATRLDEVDNYLTSIIAHANASVPLDKQPRTPIYFMATAGEYHYQWV